VWLCVAFRFGLVLNLETVPSHFREEKIKIRKNKIKRGEIAAILFSPSAAGIILKIAPVDERCQLIDSD
jgi:tRNA U34 5-methylaminomethyl-2-thiouridine-forming methyltransferase MnmC